MQKTFVTWLRAIGRSKAADLKAEIAVMLRDAEDSDKLIGSIEEYEDAFNIITNAFTRELRKR